MRTQTTVITDLFDEFMLPDGSSLTRLGLSGPVQPFDVDYTYRPGVPGCHTLAGGDPGYPAEPAELEIYKVSARAPLLWQGEGIAVATCAGAELRSLLRPRDYRAFEDEVARLAEQALAERRDDALRDRGEWLREFGNGRAD